MRLWNAHRRVLHKNPLSPLQRLELLSTPDGWRKVLDEEVVKFVDDLKANNLAGAPEQQEQIVKQLLHNTPRFFSRPKNVPLELRKQIFLYCPFLLFLTFQYRPIDHILGQTL